MAEEKNDQNTEEIQENTVPENAVEENGSVPTEEALSEEHKEKKGRFGKVVLVLAVFVIAGLFGAPQTRKIILEKYRALATTVLSDKETKQTAEVIAAEEVIEQEEIASRLEQLENARDFENAEVIVATAEPPAPPVMADPAYIALADQQKALLAEIERLRRQMIGLNAEMEQEINQLRDAIPNTRFLEDRISAVQGREDVLEQNLLQESMKVTRLEKNKADASAVLTLMARMDSAEQKIRASNAEKERAVALLLAVYQLREAAMSGLAFSTEQQSALALADFSPRIAGYIRFLSAIADRGVYTKTALLRSFDAFADQAVLSESLSPKKDWFHQALNSLKKLVVIRKINASDNDASTRAILARAGLAVKDEDLAEAVLILKDLNGPAADIMKEWIREAERYLIVKKKINETISAVLGVIYAEQLQGE